MLTRFEDILSGDGKLVYRTKGISMEPMLRQNRDLVIIRVPDSRLKNMMWRCTGGGGVIFSTGSSACVTTTT